MCSIFGLKQLQLPGHFISAAILSACLISVSQAATLPDVPVLVKSGAGAIMRDAMYTGPGSAEKSWYRPDMRAREESRAKIADFSGAHGHYQKPHYYAHQGSDKTWRRTLSTLYYVDGGYRVQ